MGQFERFLAVREGSRKDQKRLSNHGVLGVADGERGVRVAWMYPDVLNLHGGRGDLMAIMHVSCLLGIPCSEIHVVPAPMGVFGVLHIYAVCGD